MPSGDLDLLKSLNPNRVKIYKGYYTRYLISKGEAQQKALKILEKIQNVWKFSPEQVAALERETWQEYIEAKIQIKKVMQ